MRKVTLSMSHEPFHHITIEAKVNGSLLPGYDDAGAVPEVPHRDSASGAFGLVLSSPVRAWL